MVNPLPGWWILKKIIATFCDDLILLWILPFSQKSTYLWEVGRGWSKELGNFSPLSIQPSNTYRGSTIENRAFTYHSVSGEQKHEVLQTLFYSDARRPVQSYQLNPKILYFIQVAMLVTFFFKEAALFPPASSHLHYFFKFLFLSFYCNFIVTSRSFWLARFGSHMKHKSLSFSGH